MRKPMIGFPNMELHDTLHLVKRAKEGDNAALQGLLKRYLPRIHQMVRLTLGSKLRTHLESMDIVQEVLSRILKSFDKFEIRQEASFVHWVRVLVQNEIKNQAAFYNADCRNADKEIHPIKNESGSWLDIAAGLADTGKSPSMIIEAKDDMDHLAQALEHLSEDQREVIVMRQYEELSFKEIGKVLSCSEDAARMKFVRAMDKLTDIFKKDA